MTNKKDLILLAKEIHPEEFKEMQEQMQEQIEQLKEPISQDYAEALAARRLKSLNAWKAKAKEKRDWLILYIDTAKCNQLRWHKAERLAADRKKLLRRCYLFLEHAPEFPMYLLADAEELQHELESHAHEQRT